MASDPFLEEDFRVLTPEAFDFVLDSELKRAVRSQNFLTLVLVEPTPTRPGARCRTATVVARSGAARQPRSARHRSAVADRPTASCRWSCSTPTSHNSMQVIDRLVARFEHYEFHDARAIEVGAACCPTHGADAESLRRAAEARPGSSAPRRPRQCVERSIEDGAMKTLTASFSFVLLSTAAAVAQTPAAGRHRPPTPQPVGTTRRRGADARRDRTSADYRLVPGDKLRIEVYKDPQLSQSRPGAARRQDHAAARQRRRRRRPHADRAARRDRRRRSRTTSPIRRSPSSWSRRCRRWST